MKRNICKGCSDAQRHDEKQEDTLRIPAYVVSEYVPTRGQIFQLQTGLNILVLYFIQIEFTHPLRWVLTSAAFKFLNDD